MTTAFSTCIRGITVRSSSRLPTDLHKNLRLTWWCLILVGEETIMRDIRSHSPRRLVPVLEFQYAKAAQCTLLVLDIAESIDLTRKYRYYVECGKKWAAFKSQYHLYTRFATVRFGLNCLLSTFRCDRNLVMWWGFKIPRMTAPQNPTKASNIQSPNRPTSHLKPTTALRWTARDFDERALISYM